MVQLLPGSIPSRTGPRRGLLVLSPARTGASRDPQSGGASVRDELSSEGVSHTKNDTHHEDTIRSERDMLSPDRGDTPLGSNMAHTGSMLRTGDTLMEVTSPAGGTATVAQPRPATSATRTVSPAPWARGDHAVSPATWLQDPAALGAASGGWAGPAPALGGAASSLRSCPLPIGDSAVSSPADRDGDKNQ